MARSKEFDMNEVLHKAMEVFGHYGYEGTSLPLLLEGLGIARQSLYDTYGTKKDLFIKAVRHYVNEKSSAVVVHLEKTESVKEAIHGIFREIVNVLQDKDRRKECFILYSAIDQVPHEPEIAALFEEDRKRLERAFYEALVRAKEKQELSTDQDLQSLARYLYHSRYALTQVAKLTNDPKVLEEFTTVTLSTLEV
ncbi:TetR/AcrR family transcriptional repressor of nem operon [Paenibacillus rhizosphaerae]|uniref:TetR/AcrR family transcriptional repressor of nem operon n=1 Tax=Paenibacillus rhizosphaerae TaxID=297318 RepID=A0A839TXZ4_9BACL|nr:TetR/AcrR family transcriptional regulator [Paenibacillus rhizosphaerae]MBB3131353.1 TetR/AcrR family transcriptional repressor of nem operon [Paenibacillus rhizosphaerae]